MPTLTGSVCNKGPQIPRENQKRLVRAVHPRRGRRRSAGCGARLYIVAARSESLRQKMNQLSFCMPIRSKNRTGSFMEPLQRAASLNLVKLRLRRQVADQSPVGIAGEANCGSANSTRFRPPRFALYKAESANPYAVSKSVRTGLALTPKLAVMQRFTGAEKT
jgi:hypothetical protein